jgi:LPS O-antigen subunit length determinant protein (WzzB/FepE family)|tara:strand:+ start:20 stop:940 length:921 start_codon:yes stop_codon:yes gene_type:complete
MSELNNSHVNEHVDEIDIKEIFTVLWDKKFLIFFLVSLFTFGSIIYALTAPKIWVSDTVIALSSKEGQGRSSSNALGMATMAGLAVSGGTGVDKKAQLVMTSIHSRDFIKHIMSLPNTLPELMATESYDELEQTSNFNSSIYNIENNEWVQGKPPFYLIQTEYNNAVSSFYDPLGTGFIYISVKHRSPVFAQKFLNLLILEINNLLRAQDLFEAEASLEYLYDQLNKVTQSEVLESITQLIENQLRTKMIANIRDDYAIYAVDTPHLPELRFSPQRTKIVFFGIIMGLIVSIITVLGRHYLIKSLK